MALVAFSTKNPEPAVLHNEMPLLTVSIILSGAQNYLFLVFTNPGPFLAAFLCSERPSVVQFQMLKSAWFYSVSILSLGQN
jgi:hypothetical protein